MFNTVYNEVFPLIKEKYGDKVQVLFRQQVQPWHPSSTLVHEAAVGVVQLGGGFWEFSDVSFCCFVLEGRGGGGGWGWVNCELMMGYSYFSKTRNLTTTSTSSTRLGTRHTLVSRNSAPKLGLTSRRF